MCGDISNGEVLVGCSNWIVSWSWSNLNGGDFKSWDKVVFESVDLSMNRGSMTLDCLVDEILFLWMVKPSWWICWEEIDWIRFMLEDKIWSEFDINSSMLSVEWVFKWSEFGWLSINLNQFI
jgi:hypothetical protein